MCLGLEHGMREHVCVSPTCFWSQACTGSWMSRRIRPAAACACEGTSTLSGEQLFPVLAASCGTTDC